MKNFVLVFLLLVLIVILIVVSQPVKKLADTDDKDIANSGQSRYPRYLKLKPGLCKVNQYFDKAEGRCLGVIGGGRVLYLNDTQSCGTNVLKPHCSNPRYYYICKQNKTILAECPNKRHFESRLQKCVLVPRENYISDAVQLNLDTFKGFFECKRPGSFSVAGECALFYTCTRNGYQMQQDFYRCPRNMAYDAEIEMCSPSSTCESSRTFSSLCLLNSSSLAVPKVGINCETMYTNGEVIAAANIGQTTTVSVDEMSTSREKVTRVMFNDGEVAFTTVSYAKPLVSGDNDVANTMGRTQEMSRSSNIDDSTSTALHSTSTSEKKTNFPVQQRDSITAMKGISKQLDTKDDAINASPSILPDLVTSSITEKGVETSTVVAEVDSVSTTEKEVETSTIGAEINSITTTEKRVETNTVVAEENSVTTTKKEIETSTVVAEVNSVGTTEKEVETSTTVAEVNSVGTTEKEVETSSIVVEANSITTTKNEIETSTVVAEVNSITTTEKEIEIGNAVQEANLVSTTEKGVETSAIVAEANSITTTKSEIEASTVVAEVNSVDTTEKGVETNSITTTKQEIETSTIVAEINSISTTEKKIETNTVVAETNSIISTEKEVETSTIVAEVNSITTTKSEIEASTVVAEVNSAGTTENEVETSSIVAEVNSITTTEKEIEIGNAVAQANSVSTTAKGVETSTNVAEVNSVGTTEKEVETSTIVAEANSITTTKKEIEIGNAVQEANLVSTTEKRVETSTIVAEANSIATTKNEIETSTVVAEANSVGTTEKKVETSTVVVEINSVSTTEKEIETSTVLTEANSVGYTGKKVETSTVVAEINSVGTTEKEVETNTVVAETNSVGTIEKGVKTNTVVAEEDSVTAPEKGVETSTVIAETNSVGGTEKEIETSSIVAETNSISTIEKKVETNTVIAETNSITTTEKELETSTIAVEVDSSKPLSKIHTTKSGQYNTITDKFIEKTTEAVATNVPPLILTNPSTTSSITSMEMGSSEPSFKVTDTRRSNLEEYSTTVDKNIEQSVTNSETINVTPAMTSDNTEIQVETETTVILNTINVPEQSTGRTTKRLSIKDEIPDYISTISAASEFNNENVIYGSTQISIDKFSTLIYGNEKSTTELADMVTIDEEVNSDAIMTETNVAETSTNIFETNTYTVSVGNVGFTNLLNESEYSKTDFYDSALFNDTDSANYSDTMIVSNNIASSTEKINEFKTTMEIEPAVTNFSFSDRLNNNEFIENVTQATESTTFVDDSLKSTMLSGSLVSIADKIVPSSVIKDNIINTTFPINANGIFTTTVRVNINDVDNVTQTFTAIDMDNIENITGDFVTASVDTSLRNTDATNVEDVTGGSINDLETSSIVTINTIPTYIDSNSSEIVIDGITIGSADNKSVNNNIGSVTEISAPFDESSRPVTQEDALTTTIRSSTSLEELLAICRAYGLIEPVTETTVSDSSNIKEYLKSLHKNSWNTGKEKTSRRNGKEKSTNVSKQMYNERAILKNVPLPIKLVILNIVDKLELHVKNILKKLLH